MKQRGASIIFLNDQNEVLLFLRDDFPAIQCPNMWDLPGGKIEDDETPEACIVREMREEIGIDLVEFQLFERYEFPDRTEFTFWKRENLDIERLVLTEGQALRWFSRREIVQTTLAFGFNRTIEMFYKKMVF
jgi:8-oxo-dGTP diphosphatase